MEQKDRSFKVLNMKNNQSFKNVNDKLNTDDLKKEAKLSFVINT